MQKNTNIKNIIFIIAFFLIFSCKKGFFSTEIINLESYIIEIQNDDLKHAIKKINNYELRDQKVHNYVQKTFYMINRQNILHTYNETFIGFNTYLSKNLAKSFENISCVKSITKVDKDKKNTIKQHSYSNFVQIQTKQQNSIVISNKKKKIAWVIDSGIDDHKDLNIDRKRSKNFTTKNNKNKNTQDEHGHGTHVAGIIAEKAKDKMCTNLVSIKITNKEGKGSIVNALKGLDYAAFAAKAGDVINMSINGPYYEIFEKAVVHAAEKNIYVVLAAGNDGKKMEHQNSLTSIFNKKNVYIVSNIYTPKSEKNYNLSPSSNYATYSNCYAAPGEYICSTWKNNQYNILSGTSMSAPYISGLLLNHGTHFSQKKEDILDQKSGKMIEMIIPTIP